MFVLPRVCIRTMTALFLIVAFASTTFADHWPNFRGPDGRGLSDVQTIPTKITEDDFNWKVELPGKGHSSPIIWDRHIYLTGMNDEGARLIFALDAAMGKLVWQQALPFRKHRQHNFNSFASATPCADAKGVYVSWSNGDSLEVLAFDHDGNQLWRRTIGKFSAQHGSGSSPIVVDSTLIIANDNEGNESFLIGIDPENGADKWKRPRNSTRAAYATPVVVKGGAGEKGVIFGSTSHGLTCLAPATGELLWEFNPGFGQRVVSSPVIAGDVIFITAGSGGAGKESVAITVDQDGSEAKPRKVWDLGRSIPYVPTGVVYDGHIYLWADSGIVSCVKAETGEVVWQERVGGNFFGSPVCVNGHLYAMSMAGKLIVVKAATAFEKVTELDLGEPSQTTPAVAGGVMYLRTEGWLIAVGGEEVN